MNASNLEKQLAYKSRIVSSATKFNRKHKALSFLGTFYAVTAIIVYNLMFLFYRNMKRSICLASILLFFLVSSSFSYPGDKLNISFATNTSSEEPESENTLMLSDTEVAESDAVLVEQTEVDEGVLQEAGVVGNPDVEEIDTMVSVNDILSENTLSENGSKPVSVSDNASSEGTFSSDDWKIILVNKQHPIPDDYEFKLGNISGNMKCDERMITPLFEMLSAARSDGVSLIVCSPYRDMSRQTMLFSKKIDRYMGGGMSYMDAYNLASQAVTVPGSSEHQIGLAVDIITDGYSSLDEGFGETKAGKWLSANSYKYGFILRYPKGKEEITSIEYEPWHFRYVGVEAATVISENNICLEEFWNMYVE